MTTLTRTLFDRLGWTEDYLAEINDPAHPDLRDLDLMIETLHQLHQDRTRIVVMPDFDTDGVTSGVVAYVGLAQLGFNVEVYVPDYRFGHDIMPEAVADLIVKHPDVKVILTTDAGTNSHAGIGFAAQCGLRVLVTDHHQQLPSDEPLAAEVIINPYRLDETYPHPGICGAHVIFQVIQAYTQRYQPAQAPVINRLALFAGLGTVADVMPLLYENRDLVRRSLSLARLLFDPKDHWHSALYETIVHERAQGAITPAYFNAFAGFGQLLRALHEQGSIRDAYLREDLYGFFIAPAINSARRILSDGANAFRCFFLGTESGRAAAIRAVLDDNTQRKTLSAEFLAKLRQDPQPYAPYVWISDAPGGMLGLLASNISRDLDVPVAVLRQAKKGSFSGSARAPIGVDIITGLAEQPGLRAVGHAQACGVAADSEDHLALMADILCALDVRRSADQTSTEAPFPGLILGDSDEADDRTPDPEELINLVDHIASLSPFGHGFPEPLHKIVLDPARVLVLELGQATYDDNGNEITPAGRHTKLVSLNSGLQLLWWNSADERDAIKTADKPLTFLANLGVNTFRGSTKPQAIIQSRLG